MSAGPRMSGRGSLGVPRAHFRSIDSTNEHARRLAARGAPHGTLVSADSQTAGRGRQGRRWSAPPGSSVLVSLLLREVPPLLPLIAAVAVCDVAGPESAIKWPNDVVVERPGGGLDALEKVAGILAEARPQDGWAVLGIGLNVAVRIEQLPPELQPDSPERRQLPSGTGGLPAATMGLAPADVEPTLARLLLALEQRLAEPAAETLVAWRSRDALAGREIGWAQGRGRASGIDGNGRLVVVLPDGGRTALDAGEVHLGEIAG